MKLNASSLRICLMVSLMMFSQLGAAISFERISGAEGLGRIDLKHLKMNAETDFIAISNSRIFVGNAREKRVTELDLANEGRASFGLSLWDNLNINGTTYRFTVDILQSRMDINSNGDFVVASNTLLWVGNVGQNKIAQVADAGQFADFQEVRINDQGQYVAISFEKIFAGHTSDVSAQELLNDAVGNFGTAYIYNSINTGMDATVGEKRLALNSNGKFLAITSRAVYHGDVANRSITILHQEQPGQSFRHVNLSDSDQFVIVSQNEVFAGNLNAEK
jgi:hypothetical protein